MYSRVVDGRTLTFGHEGILYKNSFILYDKETRSLWIHTTGEAIRGKLRGKQLDFIPSVVTTWAKWKNSYPETTVLTGRRARGFMGTFSLARNLRSYGLSVGQGRTVKLYLFSTLAKQRIINDEVDGKKILVVFDAQSATGTAFERGDRVFEWKNGALRDASGAIWDSIKGTSGENALRPLPATPWLVGRWRPFYPRGHVYRE